MGTEEAGRRSGGTGCKWPSAAGAPIPLRGFTLIELLVVIAIIALLAAILVPVLSTVKESSRRQTCEANLKELGQAVKLYKLDWGEYPPDLLENPAAGLRALYPNYLKSMTLLHCPDDLRSQDPLFVRPSTKFLNPNTGTTAAVPYYPYISYDGPDDYAMSQNSGAPDAVNSVWKYVVNRVPSTAVQTGRTLNLLYPASDTVVTWCDRHRPLNNGVPTPQQSVQTDTFLFLDGSIRRMSYAGENLGACSRVNGYKDLTCL